MWNEALQACSERSDAQLVMDISAAIKDPTGVKASRNVIAALGCAQPCEIRELRSSLLGARREPEGWHSPANTARAGATVVRERGRGPSLAR